MLIFYVSLIFQETGIYLTDKIYMDSYKIIQLTLFIMKFGLPNMRVIDGLLVAGYAPIIY